MITDPSQFPTRFSESPEFANQVAAGRLRPVAERIGQDPLVIRPVHEIGEYGGTIRRAFQGVEDLQNANVFAGPDNLLYWDYRHEKLVPNIARDWEMSDDLTELTLHLRRGMHWSDGHPFTADDIVFWRYDINLDESVGAPSPALTIQGRNVAVDKVDDFTVRYRSPVPYGALPEVLAGSIFASQTGGGSVGDGGYAPRHYLSQFLPKHTSEEAANTAARDAGFDSWLTLLLDRSAWYLNTELPTLTPWVCTRPINDSPWELAANPHSIWVDTDGNQLPYIGTITMNDTADTQVLALRASTGEFDFQDRGFEVGSLPVLIKNEDRSDYTIHQAPTESMDCSVLFNLAYDEDEEIGDLIRTLDFRRALSLGVDRHQVNETFFLGTSVPSATMPSDGSSYFPGSEWRTKWATHDVEQANQLLDQIGLSERDEDGFRMLPSGRGRLRLAFESAASKIDFPPIGEMVRRQWSGIGIDATNEGIDGLLWVDRAVANKLMISLNSPRTEDPFIAPIGLLPVVASGFTAAMGMPYITWFLSDGSDGVEPPDSLEGLKQAMLRYRRGFQVSKTERIELGKRIYMAHADQVWTIGVVGFGLAQPGALYYAKNSLGNVPARISNTELTRAVASALPMTFYYRDG